MTQKNDSPMLELGIIAAVTVQARGIFSISRSFRCPHGFTYSVFRQTSAGPEFIQSYGPNESGNLNKDEEIHRIPIGGAPQRYMYREPYSLVDGTILELEIELFVLVADGARVTRLVVQDHQDPLKRLRDDIRWLLEAEVGQYDYSRIFFPKTKDIKLDTRGYGEKIKQKARTGDYGLDLTEVRIHVSLPPDLKKRWEADIAEWQQATISDIEKEKIEKRRREQELRKDIAQLDIAASKLEAELDHQLEGIKHEQEDQEAQRIQTKDDKARERERQLRWDEEAARQLEIRSETEQQIAVAQLEQRADLDKRKKADDFDLDREAIRQRHQLRLEYERKAQERKAQIETLQHQVSTDSLMAQLQQARRKQEELDKIHQLRLQQLEEWQKLRYDEALARQSLQIKLFEEEQRRQLTSAQQKADLGHQYELLGYEEKRTQHEIRVERAHQMNEEIHLQRLARIELGKELIRARLALIDRISTGESQLRPEEIRQLVGIDPMNDREMTPERIASFMEALNEFLNEGGVEKVREALTQLSALNRPALTEGEDKGHTGIAASVETTQGDKVT